MVRRLMIGAALVLALGGWARAQEAAEPGAAHEAGEGAAEHEEMGPPEANFVDFGWSHKNQAGGTLEKGAEPMAPPYVLALLNFLVLLGIMGRWAMPKMRSYVRDRHDEIVNALDEAARLRDEARKKLDECARRVAGVDEEVDHLVADIREQAEAEKKRILVEAELQAAALKRDAEQRISAELARARLELEREVVAAAVAAAEDLLRDKTNAGDQRNLVQQFIASLEGASAPHPGPGPSTRRPS